jgi:hypothetical protein
MTTIEEPIFRDVPAGAISVKDKVIKSGDYYNKTYTGNLEKGVPSGRGIMTYPWGNLEHLSKVTYEGNFTDGKKNGVFTVSEGGNVVYETYDMDKLVHENKYENKKGMNEAERLNKRDEYRENVGLGVREFVHQIPLPFQRRNNVFANANSRRGGTRRRKQTKRGKKSKKTRKNMRKL